MGSGCVLKLLLMLAQQRCKTIFLRTLMLCPSIAQASPAADSLGRAVRPKKSTR